MPLPAIFGRRCVLLAVLTTLGCGPSPNADEPTATSEARAFPSTDRDPLPYTPAPTTRAEAGATVALAAAGGEDQAARMLPELLIALRDADERRLESVFAEEVLYLGRRRRSSGPRLRAELVQRILIYARRSIVPADAEPGDLVDLSEVAVRRAANYFEGEDLPESIRPTDLVVEVPVRNEARSPLRTVLGWHLRGHLVVRPGRDPRIVAI